MFFTIPTQLQLCGRKLAKDNMQINVCGCAPVKLYLQNQEVGQGLPVPALDVLYGAVIDKVFLGTQECSLRYASTDSFWGKY